MSSSQEPDPTNEPAETEEDVELDPATGLTVEDDPQGTVNPSDLAGTASEDDADVS